MSLKIIIKNKRLKATRNGLENELRKLKDKLSILEKNKGANLDCAKCHALKIKNEKLKEESTRLNKFEKSTHYLNEMLSNQKPSGDKLGLGFNSFEASSSGTKEIKFVKAQKKAYSDEGLINMGCPLNDQVAPKIIMGPPPATPGSEKICLRVDLEPDEWIKDSGCSKHMTGNRKLFSTYKAYNGGNVIFGSNLRGNIIDKGQICDNKCKVTFSKHDSEITKDGKVIEIISRDGIVSRNKARLVAQGYNQQEGIDYDETYAPVARLESIRILLAYACALDFKLFQMDVKSAFLNGFINEEVYVAQPLGFIDFEKPDHVYKLKKALYGLKQAPKAWYDRLKAFLIKHEYKMGMVDNTLFTKKKSSNLIIVQIYVDDIIFGSTCQDMCDEFAKIMHDEFEMSMMGELNFFLGLQIKQMEDGIFFNQSKYIKQMLKKFGLEDSKLMKTPMSSDTKLAKDEECDVCLCARFQEAPKTSHLEAVKRIFRYIKGTTHLGLWHTLDISLNEGTSLKSSFSILGEMTLDDELRYTKSYVPTISNENYIPDILKPIIRNLECRSIHEGRSISPESTKFDNIQTLFQAIKLLKIYELHEGICPRFLLEFYSSIEITKDDNLNIFLTFWALKRTFKFSLESFASILSIPCEGECSYSEEPSLDSLETNQEANTPYQTHIPTPKKIIQSITTTGQTIFPNKILKEELRHDMRSWNEIIQDNAFGTQNDSPFLPASSCHMMYCILTNVPPRPLNPQPLQSLPSLDITVSLSPITPLENLSSPPSPSPPPP
ncbi:retrovirus-related pol polyprotein from transposon TNT 1-94 [Tanacetum coccineum]